VENKSVIKVPPVIATLFINDFFIGSYDNPIDLLNVVDEYLEGEGMETFSSTEDWQGYEAEVYFSAVNCTDGSLETYRTTHKDLPATISFKKIYDVIIEKIKLSIEYYLEMHAEEEKSKNNEDDFDSCATSIILNDGD